MLNGGMRLTRTKTRMRTVYIAAMIAFALNDFLFWAFSDTYGMYIVDYALRAVLLLFLWTARDSLPPNPKGTSSVVLFGALFIALLAFNQLCEPISARLGSGWLLFKWQVIENQVLNIFDLTVGLAMVAISEEIVSRRLALAVLPGPIWFRVIASSSLFGLAHWGEGYGQIVETGIIGLALAVAYVWTGSLGLVVAAHYAIDFMSFGLGTGQ